MSGHSRPGNTTRQSGEERKAFFCFYLKSCTWPAFFHNNTKCVRFGPVNELRSNNCSQCCHLSARCSFFFFFFTWSKNNMFKQLFLLVKTYQIYSEAKPTGDKWEYTISSWWRLMTVDKWQQITFAFTVIVFWLMFALFCIWLILSEWTLVPLGFCSYVIRTTTFIYRDLIQNFDLIYLMIFIEFFYELQF